jgi:hypothetical protein
MLPADVSAKVKCLTSDTRQQHYPGRQCGSKPAFELHKAGADRHARSRSYPEDQAEAKSPHHRPAPRAGPHEAVAEALRANACEPEPRDHQLRGVNDCQRVSEEITDLSLLGWGLLAITRVV